MGDNAEGAIGGGKSKCQCLMAVSWALVLAPSSDCKFSAICAFSMSPDVAAGGRIIFKGLKRFPDVPIVCVRTRRRAPASSGDRAGPQETGGTETAGGMRRPVGAEPPTTDKETVAEEKPTTFRFFANGVAGT